MYEHNWHKLCAFLHQNSWKTNATVGFNLKLIKIPHTDPFLISYSNIYEYQWFSVAEDMYALILLLGTLLLLSLFFALFIFPQGKDHRKSSSVLWISIKSRRQGCKSEQKTHWVWFPQPTWKEHIINHFNGILRVTAFLITGNFTCVPAAYQRFVNKTCIPVLSDQITLNWIRFDIREHRVNRTRSC